MSYKDPERRRTCNRESVRRRPARRTAAADKLDARGIDYMARIRNNAVLDRMA